MASRASTGPNYDVKVSACRHPNPAGSTLEQGSGRGNTKRTVTSKAGCRTSAEEYLPSYTRSPLICVLCPPTVRVGMLVRSALLLEQTGKSRRYLQKFTTQGRRILMTASAFPLQYLYIRRHVGTPLSRYTTPNNAAHFSCPQPRYAASNYAPSLFFPKRPNNASSYRVYSLAILPARLVRREPNTVARGLVGVCPTLASPVPVPITQPSSDGIS